MQISPLHVYSNRKYGNNLRDLGDDFACTHHVFKNWGCWPLSSPSQKIALEPIKRTQNRESVKWENAQHYHVIISTYSVVNVNSIFKFVICTRDKNEGRLYLPRGDDGRNFSHYFFLFEKFYNRSSRSQELDLYQTRSVNIFKLFRR